MSKIRSLCSDKLPHKAFKRTSQVTHPLMTRVNILHCLDCKALGRKIQEFLHWF